MRPGRRPAACWRRGGSWCSRRARSRAPGRAPWPWPEPAGSARHGYGPRWSPPRITWDGVEAGLAGDLPDEVAKPGRRHARVAAVLVDLVAGRLDADERCRRRRPGSSRPRARSARRSRWSTGRRARRPGSRHHLEEDVGGRAAAGERVGHRAYLGLAAVTSRPRLRLRPGAIRPPRMPRRASPGSRRRPGPASTESRRRRRRPGCRPGRGRPARRAENRLAKPSPAPTVSRTSTGNAGMLHRGRRKTRRRRPISPSLTIGSVPVEASSASAGPRSVGRTPVRVRRSGPLSPASRGRWQKEGRRPAGSSACPDPTRLPGRRCSRARSRVRRRAPRRTGSAGRRRVCGCRKYDVTCRWRAERSSVPVDHGGLEQRDAAGRCEDGAIVARGSHQRHAQPGGQPLAGRRRRRRRRRGRPARAARSGPASSSPTIDSEGGAQAEAGSAAGDDAGRTAHRQHRRRDESLALAAGPARRVRRVSTTSGLRSPATSRSNVRTTCSSPAPFAGSPSHTITVSAIVTPPAALRGGPPASRRPASGVGDGERRGRVGVEQDRLQHVVAASLEGGAHRQLGDVQEGAVERGALRRQVAHRHRVHARRGRPGRAPRRPRPAGRLPIRPAVGHVAVDRRAPCRSPWSG